LVGEGEVEVAGWVERDAEGEVVRPRRRRQRLELDARRPETGAAAEGGRWGRRAAAGAAKPPWSRAERSRREVVMDGGGGAHCGERLAGVAEVGAATGSGERPPCVYFIRLLSLFINRMSKIPAQQKRVPIAWPCT
jgi:hypothetical protein